eukprot:TRINITY_DN1378_c1_g1_i1.p1 TRINITY_DN1378_c1_g1~~TRINITY_DN1378_c1_g1_i1.p1  ORF type:complete len:683 (-),score=219.08 TRINITY_DN1378_c1_g1_i1:106-2154(-)
MEQHQQQQQQHQQRYHSHRGGVGGGRGNSSPRGGGGGGGPRGGGGRGGNRGGDYSPSSFHDQHRQRNNAVVATKRGGGGSGGGVVGGGRGGGGAIQSTPERRSTPTALSTQQQPLTSAESQTTEGVVWPEKFLRELCRLLAERNLLTELCHLSRVCKAWNKIASEDDLWKWIFQKQWKDPVPLNISEKERRWKELFAAKVRFSVSHLLTYFDLDEEPTDYGEEDQPAAYSDYLDLMGDSNAICSSFEELDLYEVHLKDVSYSSSSSKRKHHYPSTLEVNEKEHIVIAQNKSVDYILLLDISHFEGLATPQNPKVVLWEMLPNNNNNSNNDAQQQQQRHQQQEEGKQQMICNEYNISETFLHFLYQNCFHKWEMNYNQEAYPFSEELFSTLRLEYVEESLLMQIASGLGFESLFFSDAHNFCGVSKDEDALIFYSKGRMIFDICTESKELLSHYRDAIKSQLRRPSSSSSSSASYSSSSHYHHHHHHHSPHHHRHQQQHQPYNQHHYQQQGYDQRHHQPQYQRYNQQQQQHQHQPQHQPQHLRPYYQQPPHYQQQYYQQEQHYYPYYMPPQPGFPYMPPSPYQSGPYQAAPFNYAEVYQPSSPHQQHHHHYPPQFDVNYPGDDEEGEDSDDAYYHHGDEEQEQEGGLSDNNNNNNRHYTVDDPSSQFAAMNLHAQQHPTSSTT